MYTNVDHVIPNDIPIVEDNQDSTIITSTCDTDRDIMNLIKIIQEKKLTSTQIMEKYNINSYRFYKIVREYDLKIKKNKTGPKHTKYKQLVDGTEEELRNAKILPEGFPIRDFITDHTNKMTITELLSKYNITLYQLKELRIQYNLISK